MKNLRQKISKCYMYLHQITLCKLVVGFKKLQKEQTILFARPHVNIIDGNVIIQKISIFSLRKSLNRLVNLIEYSFII